jgi:PcfJ-like protein
MKNQKKNDLEAISRRQYAAQREARAAFRAERAEARACRDRAALDSLARYAPRSRQAGAPTCPWDAARQLLARARRLDVAPYSGAVSRLLTVAPLREGWVPRGRGRDSLFRSLAEHQLARYPTPAWLWSVFFAPYVDALVPLVVHVAGGGSLHDYVRTRGFPVPLTRRMCHELLTVPYRGPLLHAIRRVEVRSVGGDDRLLASWLRTRAATQLGSAADEAFWLTVLGWMARTPGLDPGRVAPLVDYIQHRREEDAAFSMTGRSVAAMVRGMEAWHRDLAHQEVLRGTAFPPSGFEGMELDLSRRSASGQVSKHVWRIGEILTSKDLAAEGRRMCHCVLSYARRIESGQTSIWTVTYEDGRGETGFWAMLTVEVRNDLRRVVQARGRFNRPATSAELSFLSRWAGANGLAITL